MLNRIYEQDPKLYEDFCMAYGTHYSNSIKLGGMIQLTVRVKESYFSTTDREEINANIGVSFQSLIGVKPIDEGNVVSRESRERFINHTRIVNRFYGGKPIKVTGISSEDFRKWFLRVQKDPWMIGTKLEPITRLITDERVRTQVNIAIETKLMKAHLEQMQNVLEHLQQQNSKLMSEIQYCLRQKIPKKSVFNQIKTDFNRYVSERLGNSLVL